MSSNQLSDGACAMLAATVITRNSVIITDAIMSISSLVEEIQSRFAITIKPTVSRIQNTKSDVAPSTDIISSLSSLYRETCLPEPTSTPNSTHSQLRTASHASQHLISTPAVNLTSTTPSLHSTTGSAHVPSPRPMPSVTCSSDKNKEPSSLSHHWKDLMGGVDSVNSSMEATQQVSEERLKSDGPQVSSETKYTCNHCNKQFSRQFRFINHLKQCAQSFNVKDTTSSLQLTKSNYEEMAAAAMRKQKISTTGRVVSGYQCIKCLKMIASKQSLQAHYMVHLGLKRYWCTKCGKGFVDMSNLRKHEQSRCLVTNRGMINDNQRISTTLVQSDIRPQLHTNIYGANPPGLEMSWYNSVSEEGMTSRKSLSDSSMEAQPEKRICFPSNVDSADVQTAVKVEYLSSDTETDGMSGTV